ncbi:Nitrosoguanidine resistance protein SNG1 [Wickerhamomyces ciferrii]|uniref:Nitrosoguanidine resistance protein SNG1 n=1 Tax=Wickerhamomyces ciferrii (strain ATCC 14091 / BCRC 22168 / CBS 111 / JCM 3599 / NBRC 0793 / NRRL Y-1031 F-60-10) TaxID=1206466 RepID=K0KLQ6_WICCF|nr:Nitrosoguanidine resistance protein SNG1 [Wickerhamomyces ciferrii]CCH43152.1 Nitrosoguanidine resistance protein SNG1 [Wickerhamomyces ciferrii]
MAQRRDTDLETQDTQGLNRTRTLNDSFSEESIAEEIQDLNEDVIEERIQNDDMMGTNQLERNYTMSLHDNQSENEQVQGLPPPPPQRRRSTIVDSFKNLGKFNWWDSDFKKQRLKIYGTFLTNFLVLSIILIIVLSIYFGSYYKRESRFKNFRFLVVNQDSSVNGTQPVIGGTLQKVLENPQIANIGRWISTNESLSRDDIIQKIHDQDYWAAIYVRPNISYDLHTAIQTNNTDFNVTEGLVEFIYETGRDLLTMQSYISSILRSVESGFIKGFPSSYPVILQQLDDPVNAIEFLSQSIAIKYYDHVPVTNSVLVAPLQLGLTYLVIFAFFQFIMTVKIQLYIATLVKGLKYLLLRMALSQLSYIILSLSYVVLNAAFKLDYKATFGHSGFLVLWAIAYLTMSSLGCVNEIVSLLAFTYYPPLVGGWLVIFMALNVAPAVSSMALMNHFFRYGYAFPIHNSYELVKVVFSDISKKQMGRNIGILVAWVVLSNLISPIVMIHVSKVKARRDAELKAQGGSAPVKA